MSDQDQDYFKSIADGMRAIAAREGRNLKDAALDEQLQKEKERLANEGKKIEETFTPVVDMGDHSRALEELSKHPEQVEKYYIDPSTLRPSYYRNMVKSRV